jgi:CxxC-x17-CxxC domain-containing protein
MGNFQGGGNRGGGFRGGNGGGGGFRSGNGGGRGEVTMHKATCDECHKSCEVPFRPSGDKPVYCSDCFSSKRDDGDRAPRREFSDRGPKRDFGDRPAPSFNKQASMPANDGVSKQLSEISIKLDRLTSAIEKLTAPKTESKPVVKVVEVKKAPVVKAVAKKVVAAKASAKKVVAKKKTK